ncbi:aminopeptidase [Isachenkonia alkalipeptolytica]|uniref:M18 family aminopeptidase n=1 Tax=Isachenkonia alkalipeptolytica TaxID=2565777 RepID=A0AA44BDH2_9CLOT|nr:aminopeptidase [Isachenkonia alkalipeptolytica]NBG87913.1 aminopeptidase [Isachenkonia alkalipeptolytica]
MKKDLFFKQESLWKALDDEKLKEAQDFGESYKSFIDASKTERKCVKEIIRQAKSRGFVSFEETLKDKKALLPGDKVYFMNKEKAVILAVIGKEAMESGVNIIGTHVDSPRLDLKPFPFYEDKELVLAKTHYYGGVKKYQWVTMPLAMHGVITKENGELLEITIGEDPSDPILMISDLLPHLSKDQMNKKMSEGITGEGLNVLLGNQASKEGEEKEAVKAHLLQLLKEQYDITEEDFAFAEIQLVPAGKARDVGLDQSMIAAYGHDDRVCAFGELKAIVDLDTPRKTAMAVFVDKEEVGSISNVGMESKFFENSLDEMLALQEGSTRLSVRRALNNSKALSGDVMSAFDPNFPEVLDPKNSCYMGRGVNISKYTGSRGKGGCNDANHEFLAQLRSTFNNHDIHWQMGELGKVDQGGGGTIAYIIGNYNTEVVDCGVPVLSMHAPMEIISKVDLYMTYLAYRGFYL